MTEALIMCLSKTHLLILIDQNIGCLSDFPDFYEKQTAFMTAFSLVARSGWVRPRKLVRKGDGDDHFQEVEGRSPSLRVPEERPRTLQGNMQEVLQADHGHHIPPEPGNFNSG